MVKIIFKYNFSLGEVVTIIITIAFLSIILIINISEQVAFHSEENKVFSKTL